MFTIKFFEAKGFDSKRVEFMNLFSSFVQRKILTFWAAKVRVIELIIDETLFWQNKSKLFWKKIIFNSCTLFLPRLHSKNLCINRSISGFDITFVTKAEQELKQNALKKKLYLKIIIHVIRVIRKIIVQIIHKRRIILQDEIYI